MPSKNEHVKSEIPLVGDWSATVLGLGFVLTALMGVALVSGLMDIFLRIFIGVLVLFAAGYLGVGLIAHEIAGHRARKPKKGSTLTPSRPVEQDAITLLNNVKSKKVALQKKVQASMDQLQNSQRTLTPRINDMKQKISKLDSDLRHDDRIDGEEAARTRQRRENMERDLSMLENQHASLQAERDTVNALHTKISDQVDMLDNKLAYAKALQNSTKATDSVQDALLQLQQESVEMTAMMQDAVAQFEEKQAESSAVEELMAAGAVEDWDEMLDDIDLRLAREREQAAAR